MKTLTRTAVILLAALFAVNVRAAAPTITATAGTPTATTCTITGTNTCDIIVDGVTNAVTVTIFYGGADKGATAVGWPNAVALDTAFTNGGAYTNTLTGLTPNTVIWFRARAQDLAGTGWSNAGSFTTAARAATAPDASWRERLRLGTNSLSVVTIGGTNYTVGTTTAIAADGSTNTVLKLTP